MSPGPHILQVSPREIGGGAEKVALDLHRAYLNRGIDSWLAVGDATCETDNVLSIPPTGTRSQWTRALLDAANSLSIERDAPHDHRWLLDRALRTVADPSHMSRVQRGLEDFDHPATALLPTLTATPPDVLHLHNLHGEYFDIRALPDLTADTPTILTMHDVWPLTGHCAYPLSCERWRVGCGDCPDLTLPIPIRRDASAENCRTKREALSAGKRLRVATPSRWLMRLVEASGLADALAETRVIPNGVDTGVFHPGGRAKARAALDLPDEATIVLFAARSAKSSPFKGFETLEAALPLIARSSGVADLLLVALGEDAPDASIQGVPIRFVPFAKSPETVAEHYRAADLYLHPARAESFGLAVAEAMACGVPVVASDVGGIPEIVTDGETGLLVPVDDARTLAAAAVALLADDELRERMAEAGALRIARRLSFERQIKNYLDWYAQIAQPGVRA